MRNNRVSGKLIPIVVLLVVFTPMLALAYNWTQFNGDVQHSGNNTQESQINLGNVNTLVQLFQVSLPSNDIADGAPAYLSNVTTPMSGTRDLLYLTTKGGRLVALDAHNGQQIYVKRPATTPRYTTSSPAIDPNGQYVYSYGLEGKVHKYAVGSGNETIDANWPETATLKPDVEKGSSAIAIATANDGIPRLYMANGGYPGDGGDYQGHVTTINLNTGAQAVFNAACSMSTTHFIENGNASNDCVGHVQNAIWARPGIVYNPATDKIYATTGNGDFTGNVGGHEWADSVFSLNPDGTGLNGKPLDSYTPVNYVYLNQQDLDIGSTSPAILSVPITSTYQHVAAMSGKDGQLRLLNLDALSGPGGPGQLGNEIQIQSLSFGGAVLPTPATWVNPTDNTSWLFITGYNGVAGYQMVFTGTVPGLRMRWSHGPGGSSPLVANGVLYYASNNSLHALNPTTGSPVWSGAIGGIHWESPIVVNGVAYITDENGMITAFTLPSLATGTPTATNTPSGPTNTPTRTFTPPPTTNTPTNTPLPPTNTPTNTPVGPTSTPTHTPVGPTNTPTNTPLVATNTPTNTPVGPTNTPTLTPTDCPNPFVDINGNTFYFAIHYLYCRGVVNGIDPSHFGPSGTATRAQFAKVVVLGFGIPPYTPTGAPDFNDVGTGYFAFAYIEAGFHAGILSGFTQAQCQAAGAVFPCYLPNLAITRGQVTKLVVSAAHYALITPIGGGQTYSDVPPSNVFYLYIETAHAKNVVNGFPDGTFRPNNNIQRDQMCQIVYKGVTTP